MIHCQLCRARQIGSEQHDLRSVCCAVTYTRSRVQEIEMQRQRGGDQIIGRQRVVERDDENESRTAAK